MVEIDLHCPFCLHPLQDDLSFASQKLQINLDWLSSCAFSFGVKPSSIAKLVETLFGKQNFNCHFRKFQLYVQRGLQVKALHKLWQFKQSSWLSPGFVFRENYGDCQESTYHQVRCE